MKENKAMRINKRIFQSGRFTKKVLRYIKKEKIEKHWKYFDNVGKD